MKSNDEIELGPPRIPGQALSARAALLELASASGDVRLLLHCSAKWTLDRDWAPLVAAVKPHFEAIEAILVAAAERNKELIALHRDDRIDEVVYKTLRFLRESLSAIEGGSNDR